MTTPSNLPQTVIDRRQNLWGTGLGDVLYGLSWMLIGLSVLLLQDLDRSLAAILFIFVIPIFVELVVALQSQFAEPQFDNDDTRYPWQWLAGVGLFGIIIVAIGWGVRNLGNDVLWDEFIRILVVAATIIFPLIGAIGLKFKRFYGVAGMILLCNLVMLLMGLPAITYVGVALIVGGSVLFVEGIVFGISRLHDYSENVSGYGKPRPISQAEKQAHRHFLLDGLIEMAFGGFLIVLASGIGLSEMLNFDSFIINSSALLLFIFVTGVGIPIVKKYVSAPRIGFVQLKPMANAEQINLILAAIFIIFVFAVVAISLVMFGRDEVLPFATVAWLLQISSIVLLCIVVIGLLLTAAFVYNIHRFYSISGLILLANLALFFFSIDPTVHVFIAYLTTGIILFIAGVVTFIHFRWTNPIWLEEV